jgi:hypothetical protein
MLAGCGGCGATARMLRAIGSRSGGGNIGSGAIEAVTALGASGTPPRTIWLGGPPWAAPNRPGHSMVTLPSHDTTGT